MEAQQKQLGHGLQHVPHPHPAPHWQTCALCAVEQEVTSEECNAQTTDPVTHCVLCCVCCSGGAPREAAAPQPCA